MILLKESWHELFILGAAQFLAPMELNPLVASCIELNGEKLRNIVEEAAKLQEAIAKLKQLQVDVHEYTFMRATILFKRGSYMGNKLRKMIDSGLNAVIIVGVEQENDEDEKSSLKEVTTVRALHEGSQQMLNQYVTSAYPLQPFRLGKLYMTMSAAKNVSAEIIENLFFRKTIGDAPLSRIICGIYVQRLRLLNNVYANNNSQHKLV